jgi:hypothetical protein
VDIGQLASLIVLGALSIGIIWALVRTYRWRKRSRRIRVYASEITRLIKKGTIQTLSWEYIPMDRGQWWERRVWVTGYGWTLFAIGGITSWDGEYEPPYEVQVAFEFSRFDNDAVLERVFELISPESTVSASLQPAFPKGKITQREEPSLKAA